MKMISRLWKITQWLCSNCNFYSQIFVQNLKVNFTTKMEGLSNLFLFFPKIYYCKPYYTSMWGTVPWCLSLTVFKQQLNIYCFCLSLDLQFYHLTATLYLDSCIHVAFICTVYFILHFDSIVFFIILRSVEHTHKPLCLMLLDLYYNQFWLQS